jgi:hypothetical protein
MPLLLCGDGAFSAADGGRRLRFEGAVRPRRPPASLPALVGSSCGASRERAQRNGPVCVISAEISDLALDDY